MMHWEKSRICSAGTHVFDGEAQAFSRAAPAHALPERYHREKRRMRGTGESSIMGSQGVTVGEPSCSDLRSLTSASLAGTQAPFRMSRASSGTGIDPSHLIEVAALSSSGNAHAGSPHRHRLHTKGSSGVSYPSYTVV